MNYGELRQKNIKFCQMFLEDLYKNENIELNYNDRFFILSNENTIKICKSSIKISENETIDITRIKNYSIPFDDITECVNILYDIRDYVISMKKNPFAISDNKNK